MEKYSKIELLALIKIYNKTHDDKIKNVDKMKKEDLIEVCENYALLDTHGKTKTEIDLRNIAKKDLMRDIQLYFMKQNQNIPSEVIQMRKQDLIDYMELNAIKHYTPEILQQELQEAYKYNELKNIIAYNIIRYDNVDVTQLDIDLNSYIVENNLDVDTKHLNAYAMILRNLISAYETFCRDTGNECEYDKIKSIPKMISRIQNICQKIA